jgi:hypothetical protein
MTDEAVSLLRRRMIEDMTIRKFAPKTQHDYVQRGSRTSLRSSGDHPIRRVSRTCALPVASGRERRWRADHQSDGIDAAVLF